MTVFPANKIHDFFEMFEVKNFHLKVFTYLLELSNYQLSKGEICEANFKAPLRMMRVWTGYKLPYLLRSQGDKKNLHFGQIEVGIEFSPVVKIAPIKDI